jgi:hypothetical protein
MKWITVPRDIPIAVVQVGVTLYLAQKLIARWVVPKKLAALRKKGTDSVQHHHDDKTTHHHRPATSLDDSSCCGESDTDDDDDNDGGILMAVVSTVLMGEESAMKDAENDAQDGKIVARIVPKDNLNYFRTKPRGRRCDANRLKSILNNASGTDRSPTNAPAAPYCDDLLTPCRTTVDQSKNCTYSGNRADRCSTTKFGDFMATIKVDATLSSARFASVQYRVQMNMQCVKFSRPHPECFVMGLRRSIFT